MSAVPAGRRAPMPDAARALPRDPRLLAALAAGPTDPAWRAQGACLRHDPEVFFPTPAEDPSIALSVCAGCPVRAACLASALDAGECDGVWGQTTPDERRAMRALWPAPAAARA